MDTFNERLEHARIMAGLTQVSIAKQLCMARQTYLDLEKGKTIPRLNVINLAASITGCDRVWLAFGEGEAPKNHRALLNNIARLIEVNM